MQVNTFSPMLITQYLLDILNKSNGRVINVSSIGHTMVPFDKNYPKNWDKSAWLFTDNQYSPILQYSYSKLGNVFFTQYLSEYITQKNLNIKTVSLHPGLIATNLYYELAESKLGFSIRLYLMYLYIFKSISLMMGAQTTLHCCYADNSELVNGGYYSECKLSKVGNKAQFEKRESRYSFIEWARHCINQNSKDSRIEFNIELD